MVVLGILVVSNVSAAPKGFDLHQAVLDKNINLVKRLLSKGADINLIGPRKFGDGSALHLAIREGNVDIARLLIDRGADVDALDQNDFTPLHNAAWSGNLKLVKILLNAGANIKASTYDGDTPLSLAQNNEQAEVAKFIQAKLQAPAVTDVRVESLPVIEPGVIDISGTYSAYVTGDLERLMKRNKKTSDLLVRIVQKGSDFEGSYENMDGYNLGAIWGEIKGDTIKFHWQSTKGSDGTGKWTFNSENNEASGKWAASTWYGEGKWNMTKIE